MRTRIASIAVAGVVVSLLLTQTLLFPNKLGIVPKAKTKRSIRCGNETTGIGLRRVEIPASPGDQNGYGARFMVRYNEVSNWERPQLFSRADFCTMFVQPNRYCGLFRHCGHIKIQ